jgi:hypothetical protein
MLDRHAPSVLSLDEMAAMVDELLEATATPCRRASAWRREAAARKTVVTA